MHLRQPVLWSHCPPGASGGRGGYCLIHQYSLNGYNIVLDVDSGSVHIVDGLVYELIALIEGNRDLTDEAVIRRFSGRYAEEEIKDALEEIHELEKAGQLFAEDIYKRYYSENPVRIVLITGPSSSGKTTVCRRLSVQLKACGLRPVFFSSFM